jgi:TRAP-type C4-dicarboxylate transport system substrate-binding protein
MKRKNAVLAICLLVLGSAAGLAAQVLTLRMAANVPTGSPWDIGLHRLAGEFARISGGRVRMTFPQSARISSESDIIQRMRFGIDGALLTTYGIAQLYPDSLALSMPSLIGDDAEFDAVLAAVTPLFESKLGDRYALLALSRGGWIRYFSRSPIVYPSDLARLRFSMDATETNITRLMEDAGARTVTGTTADFLLQINANSVDATFASPIYIASLWSQLRGKIGYMSSFKVAPFLGALIFNKASWERVPVDLRPALEKVVEGMARRISEDSAKLEQSAIDSLDGIRSPALSADAAAKWAAQIAEWRRGLVARMFSPDILDAIDAALAKARKAE